MMKILNSSASCSFEGRTHFFQMGSYLKMVLSSFMEHRDAEQSHSYRFPTRLQKCGSFSIPTVITSELHLYSSLMMSNPHCELLFSDFHCFANICPPLGNSLIAFNHPTGNINCTISPTHHTMRHHNNPAP